MVLSFLSRPGPILMGILNVTPDSFSDGGEYFTIDAAVTRALAMIREGAGIIDIGGESTRPPGTAYGAGAAPVDPAEESSRVLPVITALRAVNPTIPISIDTQHATVAEQALRAGATIVNDVSAGTTDPELFDVTARHGAPIVLMHGHGPNFQKASIEDYVYKDVVASVLEYLSERITAARKAGIMEIIADVGIGFGKAYRDNLTLIREHGRFTELGVPLLLGVSRKSTIGLAMGGGIPPRERVIGSVAAACYGVLHGAKIIRTHDVKATRDGLAVFDRIITP